MKHPANDTRNYHLAELRTALDPADPARILPGILPGGRVLDIGCGAGQTLIAACPDGARAFGVDVDFGALELGKTLTGKVRFTCGAAIQLPFKAEAFDQVICRVSLPYTNIPRSLAEVRRVLKPGGIVWMTLHPFSMAWEQALRANWKGRIYFGYIVLNSLLLHLGMPQFGFFKGRTESFQTEAGMRRCLRRAGFGALSIQRGRHFLVTAKAV